MLTHNFGVRARLIRRGFSPLVCAVALLACDNDSQEAAGTGNDPTGTLGAAVEGAVDEAVAKAGGSHLFDPEDKAFRKRACDFLTPELVASSFDVPAAELKQMKIMGCIYTWKSDAETLDAKLMMIRVHKDVDRASQWFGNATANKTKAELDAEMDVVKGKVKERKELDTDLKKNTAASLTDIAKLGSPDEGVAYEDVPGIGDAARVSSSDGALWVRLDNVTFQVSAYKGPPQPKVKFDPKNLKGIAKAAMTAQKKWLAETHDQRKQAALKIAPKVVAAITSAR